ncbi:MAG: FixH family protein [Gammaproteobacteria bacterium]|nr:FixH family protein [Gammaproteobacteria bacterium]
MTTALPWFKQFWVWFVIAIPLVGVVSGLSLVIIATSGHNDMVVDDYYKKGKAINQSLVRQERAAAMGLAFALTIDNDSLVVRQQPSSAAVNAARVHLYHPTLADHDQHLVITADASGALRGALTTPLSGQWRIAIEAMDGEWLLQDQFSLPRTMPINLIAR